MADTAPLSAASLQLLEALVLTPGVPGREHRVRELIRREVQGMFDEVREDVMGSLLCVKRASRPGGQRIMLAAHMDQIGFLIRHIDEKGFCRVNPVGGFDTRNLFARLCTVCPDVRDPAHDLPGVMNPSGKPIHIATDADKSKVPTIEEFVIDLGLPPEVVKEKIKLGDMVVLRAFAQRVGSTFVSQCLDNRIACWVAIEAMRAVADSPHEIHCVFTVQEEVGLRGALTAAYAIGPDIGIAIDTTLAVDVPGVSDDYHVSKMGGGAALTIMDGSSIADLSVLEAFEALAKEKHIPHQRSILMRGGTDAGAVQRAGSGSRTFTLSCPTRYIHTVTEMVALTDLAACRDLLAAYLSR